MTKNNSISFFISNSLQENSTKQVIDQFCQVGYNVIESGSKVTKDIGLAMSILWIGFAISEIFSDKEYRNEIDKKRAFFIFWGSVLSIVYIISYFRY